MATADFRDGLKSHLDAIIISAATSLVVISNVAIGVICLSDCIDDNKGAISDLKTDVATIKTRIDSYVESHNREHDVLRSLSTNAKTTTETEAKTSWQTICLFYGARA